MAVAKRFARSSLCEKFLDFHHSFIITVAKSDWTTGSPVDIVTAPSDMEGLNPNMPVRWRHLQKR